MENPHATSAMHLAAPLMYDGGWRPIAEEEANENNAKRPRDDRSPTVGVRKPVRRAVELSRTSLHKMSTQDRTHANKPRNEHTNADTKAHTKAH